MKKQYTFLSFIFLAGSTALAPLAHAQSYSFQTVQFPGANQTYIAGIDGGNVVGNYYDSNWVSTSFVYNGSNYSDFTLPVFNTGYGVMGIQGNIVVGYYSDNTTPGYTNVSHGFSFDGIHFLTYDHPLSGYTDNNNPGLNQPTDTRLLGISGNSVFGQYRLVVDPGVAMSDKFIGFVYDGNYTSIEVPDAQSTQIRAISNGIIYGNYQMLVNGSWGPQHGFTFDGAVYSQLIFPGSTSSSIWGVSGNTVVGTYAGEDYIEHGYLFDGSTFTTFDYTGPGAVGTALMGINGDTLWGYSYDADWNNTSFIATPAAIPEPSTYGLIGVGALAVAIAARRRKQ